jgi:hypothetical protein
MKHKEERTISRREATEVEITRLENIVELLCAVTEFAHHWHSA